MESIKIHGKEYFPVSERLKVFRKDYADHSLDSTIVQMDNGLCVIKAEIANKDGRVMASGHAYEKEGSGNINKTSYVENCETSAWGRALANLGVGIDESIASADEVANAVQQQKKTTPSSAKKATPPQEKDDVSLISEAQLKRLCTIISKSKFTMEEVDARLINKFQLDSKKKIPKFLYQQIIDGLEGK